MTLRVVVDSITSKQMPHHEETLHLLPDCPHPPSPCHRSCGPPDALLPLVTKLGPPVRKWGSDRHDCDEARPSSRIVHASTDSMTRCVSLQGSRASVSRTVRSESALIASTTRCPSESGPPRMTKPASTSPSMNEAWAGHSDCCSSGSSAFHLGPDRRSTTKKAMPMFYYDLVGFSSRLQSNSKRVCSRWSHRLTFWKRNSDCNNIAGYD